MNSRPERVKYLMIVAAAGMLFAAACHDADRIIRSTPAVVHGDGNVVEEAQTIGSFRNIDLQGVGILHIQQGSREELVIRAEANLLEYLRTDTQGGHLLIWKDPVTLFNTRPIEYYLTVVDLEQVTLSGAGTIEGAVFDTDSLSLRLTGAGNIEFVNLTASALDIRASGVGDIILSGSAQEQAIELRGVGSYDGRELDSAEADVLLNSGGSATVQVRDRLRATINGIGSVYYIGDPVVETSGSGSGNVIKL